MTRTMIRAVAALIAGLGVFLAVASDSSAHERRAIADKFTFVVGFDQEPVFLESKNAVFLRVSDSQTNQPVEGVEKTLKVDVTNSNQTRTFDLVARRTAPGTYTADVIPTKGGSWVFQFKGDINGTPINERFESGPGRFNEPAPQSDLQFPAQLPSMSDVAQQLQTGGTAPEAASTSGTAPDVQRALDRANSARTLGLTLGGGGVVLALASLGMAAYALSARRRSGDDHAAEPV